MNAGYLTVTKTARYFTLGEWHADTKEIWFVLHGYAQLAGEFIQEFSSLINPHLFIVAPEGLNRFYARGFGGKAVATWMTSEDREHEISDYVNYLNALYESFSIPTHVKVRVLGFSQGVATASRFIHQTHHKIDSFIICSGEIGAELTNPVSDKLKSLPITYITGNNDPFITPEKHQKVLGLMEAMHAKILRFDGGHEINISCLQQLS